MSKTNEFHLKMGNTLGEEKGTLVIREKGEWSRWAGVEGISERQNWAGRLM